MTRSCQRLWIRPTFHVMVGSENVSCSGPHNETTARLLRNIQNAVSTKDYDTNWIHLQTGIAMGCTVSPILFVLAMQVILKASEKESEGAHLGDGVLMAPLKAFMDDTTILTSSKDEADRMLLRLIQLQAKEIQKPLH